MPSRGGVLKIATRGSDCESCCAMRAPFGETGVLRVAGVDEAGMSPLAGPVAAAAVIFAPASRIPGIDDSKKLDAAERDRLAVEIKESAVAWCVGFAEVEEIDTVNIYWAGLLAMRRAIEGLSCRPQHILIDARRLKDLQIPQQPIVKGDSKSLTIAAASILAKTTRDALMHELDADYPGYGFSKHKGYPVREHLAALKQLGVSPIHRRSFAPVRSILGLPPLPPSVTVRSPTSGDDPDGFSSQRCAIGSVPQKCSKSYFSVLLDLGYSGDRD